MLSALAFQELYQELRIDRRILTIPNKRLELNVMDTYKPTLIVEKLGC